jgi:hypothetical protein
MKAAKLKEIGTTAVTYTFVEEHVELGQVIFYQGYIWEVVSFDEKLIN